MNKAVQLIRTLNRQLSFTPLNSFMCEAVLNEEPLDVKMSSILMLLFLKLLNLFKIIQWFITGHLQTNVHQYIFSSFAQALAQQRYQKKRRNIQTSRSWLSQPRLTSFCGLDEFSKA